jgi:hypothetical protein
MSGTRTFVAVIACSALLASFPAGEQGTSRAAPRTAGPSGSQAMRTAIDREARARWRALGLTEAPGADHGAYVRRVTLDIAGRVPSVGEVDAFVADKSTNKFEKLVDRLLASPDYADHWSGIYLDLLVGRELRFRRGFSRAAADYLYDSFAANKRMDRFAIEMLTARGDLRTNGASSFLVAQRLRGGDISTLTGTVARTFLGVQIQCAQCHDHPHDKRYKQEDFRDLAAYFGATRIRVLRDPDFGPNAELIDQARPYAPANVNRDKNPHGGEPRFLGRATPPKPGETRRQVLARTIVDSELFPKVTVNRTWAHLFGHAIVAPWDDLGGEGATGHPRLLQTLATEFARSGFDHRQLVRAIVLSAPYRRASTGGQVPAGATDRDVLEREFARAAVRPLSASQLFYSQLQVTGIEGAARGFKGWKVEERVERALREYLFAFEDDEGGESDTFTGSVPQALLLRNGALTNQGARAIKGLTVDRVLAASKDPAQRLTWLFEAAYARAPSAAERALFQAHLEARLGEGVSVRAAHEDLLHALLTSTEFLTNH